MYRLKSLLCLSLLSVALLASEGDGARILGFFPFGAKSHHNVFKPLFRELAARGHEVTYMTPYPIPNPPKTLTHIQVPDVHSLLIGKMNLSDFMGKDTLSTSMAMYGMGLHVGEIVYSSPPVQKIIHSNAKFDLLILESFFVSEASAALQHKFKAPVVDILPLGDSAWVNEVMGITYNPSYFLDFRSPYNDKMTFLQRLHNFYITLSTLAVSYAFTLTSMEWQASKYFNYSGWEDRPSLIKMMSNKSLVLLNSHHATNFPTAYPPNVKEVGGLNINPPQPLPKDLQNLMDSAKDGVLYFSLGSNIPVSQFLIGDTLKAFTETFATLKMKVLWKWDHDHMPNQPKNVHIAKWFPQQDILAHKNCKVFLTHGGYLSLVESIYNGVPLVGIPFFGDQEKNMQHVESSGYGIKIDIKNITKTTLTWAINRLLHVPTYKAEAMRRSRMYKDRKTTALDESVFWVEYILKHGDVLRSRAQNLPWHQLYALDILGLLALTGGTLALAGLLFCCCLRKLCGLVAKKEAPKDSKKSNKKKNN